PPELGPPSPDLALDAASPGPVSPPGSEGGGSGVDDAGVVPPEESTSSPPTPTPTNDQLLLGTYPNLWADQVVESSPALRFLVPVQRLEISGPDTTRLGLTTGDEVSVSSGDGSVNARVAVRAAMPEGSCFLIEGTPADNGNRVAGEDGGPVPVEVGPPEVRLELVTAGGGPEGDEAG
ncbi:MAG: molybdopterin dinucleotide binding domain-containing protein, partial [Solirubrobacterales bacterium]